MWCVIAAAGEVADGAALAKVFAAADLVIAADGGLRHVVAAGAEAGLVVGDLDSADAEQLRAATARGAEIERHPVDKDETDLELALLAALERGASRVTVVGLLGGRVDHELANISLIASQRWAQLAIDAWDGAHHLWVTSPRGECLDLRLAVGTTVSVLPWHGDADQVTTTGVRWPLDGESLPAGSPRGMSNIATEPVQTFRAGTGRLLIIADDRDEPSAVLSADLQ